MRRGALDPEQITSPINTDGVASKSGGLSKDRGNGRAERRAANQYQGFDEGGRHSPSDGWRGITA
jgi:hypothetical protein